SKSSQSPSMETRIMGSFVICAFRPKPGQESKLLDVLKTHIPILKGEDLITDRPPCFMKSSDGTILELFEWKSADHSEKAHENQAVLDVRARLEACCDYLTLRDVPETTSPFPNFESIDLG
ncbi:MAG: hypothetical protein O7G85_15225, partial [Planctomycetota bacterium]|nr:hypothetical protein [Planctomycetota bacterium]